MRPVSDAFLRAIRDTNRMLAEAKVVPAGTTGTNPDGVPLTIIDGDVRLDGTAQIRSTLDLTVDGNTLWPTAGNGRVLAPYGNEIHVRRGIRMSGGSVEWVSLGYHRIDTADQDEAPNGPITITGGDRMGGIVKARLTEPRQYASTVTVGAVFDDLVKGLYPWATIEWDDDTDDETLGRDLIVEQDRYQALANLVASRGKVWYWDHRGILVITDPPPATVPVWEVTAGRDGVLIRMSRTLSSDDAINGVVATGEALDTTPPVRGIAVDGNSTSPTYWNGAFGQRPRFYSSPLITTTAQAQQAAETMLRINIGLSYSVDFTAVPNPALTPYDVVRVRYSSRHASEIHILDKLTIPLVPDQPLTGQTREQTAVVIGGSL